MKNTNEQILELSKLVDAGRISQEEFDVLKKELLENDDNVVFSFGGFFSKTLDFIVYGGIILVIVAVFYSLPDNFFMNLHDMLERIIKR